MLVCLWVLLRSCLDDLAGYLLTQVKTSHLKVSKTFYPKILSDMDVVNVYLLLFLTPLTPKKNESLKYAFKIDCSMSMIPKENTLLKTSSLTRYVSKPNTINNLVLLSQQIHTYVLSSSGLLSVNHYINMFSNICSISSSRLFMVCL